MISRRIAMCIAVLTSLTFLPGGINEKIQNLKVKAGDSVTLQTGLSGLHGEHILWIYGSSQTLLLCSDRDLSDPPEEYQGRLHLDQSSGSLTICNVRRSCVYRGEVFVGNEKHIFDYNVTVDADPRAGPPFNSAADPRSPQGLILAAAVCLVLFNN